MPGDSDDKGKLEATGEVRCALQIPQEFREEEPVSWAGKMAAWKKRTCSGILNQDRIALAEKRRKEISGMKKKSQSVECMKQP